MSKQKCCKIKVDDSSTEAHHALCTKPVTAQRTANHSLPPESSPARQTRAGTAALVLLDNLQLGFIETLLNTTARSL